MHPALSNVAEVLHSCPRQPAGSISAGKRWMISGAGPGRAVRRWAGLQTEPGPAGRFPRGSSRRSTDWESAAMATGIAPGAYEAAKQDLAVRPLPFVPVGPVAPQTARRRTNPFQPRSQHRASARGIAARGPLAGVCAGAYLHVENNVDRCRPPGCRPSATAAHSSRPSHSLTVGECRDIPATHDARCTLKTPTRRLRR